MIKHTSLIFTLLLCSLSTSATTQQFRSLVHFTPEKQWMNDPNGLVFYQGEYHLFYQHNPHQSVWGPMHWGHAISDDLVHWQHQPIALAPDELGTIFSGSAVVDTDNTSGLGSTSNPPMIAIFTYHNPEREHESPTQIQTQGLAFSLDKGRTWQKYDGNPVLPSPGIKDFRDPKVRWYEQQQKWIMSVAAKDHIRFYSSENLLQWQYESSFKFDMPAHIGVWECPDLFPINVAGTNKTAWVLLVSVNAGAPNQGSGTLYFVGDFDGQAFTLHPDVPNYQWLDYGTDNFAGITWNMQAANASLESKYFIGWMNNWMYANQIPTDGWRGAMTFPRTLTLHQHAQKLSLHSVPVQQLETLRTPDLHEQKNLQDIQSDTIFAANNAYLSYEMNMTVKLTQNEKVDIIFANEKQHARFTIDPSTQSYSFDRSHSGNTQFSEAFSGVIHAPIQSKSSTFQVQAIVDQSSIELFINDGRTVITARVFPDKTLSKVSFSASDAMELLSAERFALRTKD